MAADAATAVGSTLVLYDGVCGFCASSVQFLLRRDPRGRFRFAALQSKVAQDVLAKHGARADDLDTVYVVDGYGTPEERVLSRSDAALHCAGLLGWPWKLARIATLLPASLRNIGYDLIARHRYRIFGKLDACMIPDPAIRDRFIG